MGLKNIVLLGWCCSGSSLLSPSICARRRRGRRMPKRWYYRKRQSPLSSRLNRRFAPPRRLSGGRCREGSSHFSNDASGGASQS